MSILPLDILRLLPSHLSVATAISSNIHTYHRLRLVCRLWRQAFPIPKTVLTYFEVVRGWDTDFPEEQRLIGVTFCLGYMVPFIPASNYLPLFSDWEEKYSCWADEIPYSQMIRFLRMEECWGVAPSRAKNKYVPVSRCVSVCGWGAFAVRVPLGIVVQSPIILRDLSSEELWDLLLPRFILEISHEPLDPLDGPLLIYRGSEFLCFLLDNGSELMQEPKDVDIKQGGLTYVIPRGDFRHSMIDEGYCDWDYKIARDIGI